MCRAPRGRPANALTGGARRPGLEGQVGRATREAAWQFSGQQERLIGALLTLTTSERGESREPDELLEVQNGGALGDRRRIDRDPDVLSDPLGGTPGGLIGADLVVTHSHCLSTVVGAERGVAREPHDRERTSGPMGTQLSAALKSEASGGSRERGTKRRGDPASPPWALRWVRALSSLEWPRLAG